MHEGNTGCIIHLCLSCCSICLTPLDNMLFDTVSVFARTTLHSSAQQICLTQTVCRNTVACMCMLSWKPGHVAIGLGWQDIRSDLCHDKLQRDRQKAVDEVRPYCLYRASNVKIGLEVLHPEQDTGSFRRVAPDMKASLSLISHICDHYYQTLKQHLCCLQSGERVCILSFPQDNMYFSNVQLDCCFPFTDLLRVQYCFLCCRGCSCMWPLYPERLNPTFEFLHTKHDVCDC